MILKIFILFYEILRIGIGLFDYHRPYIFIILMMV